MQTHKNPNLRSTSVVPQKTSEPAPKSAPKFGSTPAKKDPIFELDGKKWMVCTTTLQWTPN